MTVDHLLYGELGPDAMAGSVGQSPGQVHYYCNYAWGGIGQDHYYLDEWCPEPDVCLITPVEDVSWGSIKSMYR